MVFRDELTFKCDFCGGLFGENKKLASKHPFNSEKDIFGCPHCSEVTMLDTVICHNKNCDNESAGIVQTFDAGYVPLCFSCENKVNKQDKEKWASLRRDRGEM